MACIRSQRSLVDIGRDNYAMRNQFFFNDEVAHALANKLPIVALESTVLSHGLPFPENLDLANSLEDIVRKGGCVPCTIALLDGKIHFGLTVSQIERLALAGKQEGDKPKEKIHKASVRDLAWILSTGSSGATTVAATSFLANLIGVRVFATGGIGGVHRDGHITMDVSADLVEMSRSPVIVVCAGAKSILDIGRTLEYLETLGVPVIGYGTDEFPAFFTRKSDTQVPLRLDTAEAIAKLMHKSLELNIGRGILVGVPISPKDEADAIVVEKAIQQALKEADEQKIVGRDITPFILGRVSKLTAGHSLKANIALLQQNAGVAAQIAYELNKLIISPNTSCTPALLSCCPGRANLPTSNITSPTSSCNSNNHSSSFETIVWHYKKEGSQPAQVSCQHKVFQPIHCPKYGTFGCNCDPTSIPNLNLGPKPVARPSKGPVVVVGALAIDVLSVPISAKSSEEEHLVGLSIPGQVTLSAGGVGRNIAEALTHFGIRTTIISAVGAAPAPTPAKSSTNATPQKKFKKPDSFGQFVIEDCNKKGIIPLVVPVPNESTAVYSALSYPDGKFRGGVAHMSVLDRLTPQIVDQAQSILKEARLIVIDANIPAKTVDRVLTIASHHRIPTLFEATSAAKVIKLAEVGQLNRITFFKPNESELRAVVQALQPDSNHQSLNDCIALLLSLGIQHVLVTLGAKGVLIGVKSPNNESEHQITHIEAEPIHSKIVDVNGAGDSFVSGFIFGHLSGLAILQSTKLGLRAARLTCESVHSVSPKISPNLLSEFATQSAAL